MLHTTSITFLTPLLPLIRIGVKACFVHHTPLNNYHMLPLFMMAGFFLCLHVRSFGTDLPLDAYNTFYKLCFKLTPIPPNNPLHGLYEKVPGHMSLLLILWIVFSLNNPTWLCLFQDTALDPGEDVALLSVSFEDAEATQVFPKLYLSPSIEQ